MMTDNANPSEKVLTNDDLNALAVRLIAVTSRFRFGADGSYQQLVQRDEIRPFASDLDALATDLALAAERIRPLARLMRAQINRGRAQRYFSPQDVLIAPARP
jgi:uncharacterized membrane-anchored protein